MTNTTISADEIAAAVRTLTPVQRQTLAAMARTVEIMPSRDWRLSHRLTEAQVRALLRRGLAEADGTAFHKLSPLGVAVAEVVGGVLERRAAEAALRGALDAVAQAPGAEERAEAYAAAGEALDAADAAGVDNFLSDHMRRRLEGVKRAQRGGPERVERIALRVAEEWRALMPQAAEERPAAPVVCKGAVPAALPALDAERTAVIMARLDRVYLAGYVTGPGLSYEEQRAAALVVADHHTDGGTRLTATGMDRDEVFWWHYNGSTYDAMNAYGSVRLATGAIRRPAHVCGWGCGTPCPQAAQEAAGAPQEGGEQQEAQEAVDGAQEAQGGGWEALARPVPGVAVQGAYRIPGEAVALHVEPSGWGGEHRAYRVRVTEDVPRIGEPGAVEYRAGEVLTLAVQFFDAQEAAQGAAEDVTGTEGDPAWVARRDEALGVVLALLDGTAPRYRRAVLIKDTDAQGAAGTMTTEQAWVYLAEEIADGGVVVPGEGCALVLTRANGARLLLRPVA